MSPCFRSSFRSNLETVDFSPLLDRILAYNVAGVLLEMAFLSNVHLSCFLLSYLVAFGGEIFQLLRRRTGATRVVLILAAIAGLVAHTAYLMTRSSNSGLPPLVGSSHDWLLVLAWLTAVVYLMTVVFQSRHAVSILIVPALILLVVMAIFVDDSARAADRETASYRWGMLHATTLMLGMASVVAATLSAYMYLLQYRKLRGQSSWLHRFQLPSLETLTSMTRTLVVATVVLLTIGMATGVILGNGARNSGSDFSWADPLVVSTIVIWAGLVACLFWLLTQKEQTGRQVARLTLVAGGFLLLTIFGLMLLSGGVHGSSSTAAANPDGDLKPFIASDRIATPKGAEQ